MAMHVRVVQTHVAKQIMVLSNVMVAVVLLFLLIQQTMAMHVRVVQTPVVKQIMVLSSVMVAVVLVFLVILQIMVPLV
jgi:hypothetical protein